MGPEGAGLIDENGWSMKGFWHDAVEFLPILLNGVVLTIVVTIGSLLLSSSKNLCTNLSRATSALTMTLKRIATISTGLGSTLMKQAIQTTTATVMSTDMTIEDDSIVLDEFVV